MSRIELRFRVLKRLESISGPLGRYRASQASGGNDHLENGAGEAIVQAHPVPVEGDPQQTGASSADRDECGGEPAERTPPPEPCALARAHPDLPRPHPEGLSALRPAPAEVDVAHHEQVGGEYGVVRADGSPAGDDQRRHGGREEHREQKQGVVDERGEPPEQSGARRRGGSRRTGVSRLCGHVFGSVTPRCLMYFPARSR